MPALDHLEPKVINALQKSGWRITDSQFLLRVGKRKVFIDLKAQRINEDRPEQIIIIEVKSFEGKSSVRDLEEAIGQYVIYRALFEEYSIEFPLFLAVPHSAYQGILKEPLGEIVLRRLYVKIIVFDEDSEEIVEWLS